jgi:hypothetical protein
MFELLIFCFSILKSQGTPGYGGIPQIWGNLKNQIWGNPPDMGIWENGKIKDFL